MPGRIPQQFIDDLISRVDVVEVVESRLKLKRAGRENETVATYRSALEVNAPPHDQALARLLAREPEPPGELRQLLQTVALEGETPESRAWAKRLLALSQP